MEKNGSIIDQQIFGQLWSIFLAHKPVRLLNVFHSIPISYEATISMVSQTYLGLSIHHYQATCISLERYTYLQSERLPLHLRGHALEVDVRKGEVILERLVPVSNNFGNRSNLRVQPKVPVPIEIQNNSKMIIASLADRSRQGVDKFVLGVLAESEFNLRQNQEVDLWVNLPFSESKIQVRGIAGRHSFDQKRNLYRINIQLLPDSSSQPVLTDYISHRQTETMQELEFIYKSIRKPPL